MGDQLPLPTVHLNSRNREGDTPLMIAAGQLQTDIVSVLVKKGVDVYMENGGNTALHKAIAGYTSEKKEACKDIVHQPQKKGATPKGYVDKNTPLHTAVRQGALEIVELLSNYKGKDEVLRVKTKDEKEETPLQLAVRLGETDIVESLLSLDSSWRLSRKETLKTVYAAIAGGHKEILDALIKEGKLDWKSLSGDCLMMAVEDNDRNAVNFLYGENLPHPGDD